jgi:hypothetical protein
MTAVEMCDLLQATDRLDTADLPDGEERDVLLERVRTYERAAARKIEDLRVQLARAEDFVATLRTRTERTSRPLPT